MDIKSITIYNEEHSPKLYRLSNSAVKIHKIRITFGKIIKIFVIQLFGVCKNISILVYYQAPSIFLDTHDKDYWNKEIEIGRDDKFHI